MKTCMRWRAWLHVIGAAFLVHECAMAATAEEAAPALPTSEVLKFTFGTPDSLIRMGFTKVTTADRFASEKGVGFESTEEQHRPSARSNRYRPCRLQGNLLLATFFPDSVFLP